MSGTARDRAVLGAVVAASDDGLDIIGADELCDRTGLDADSVQLSLQALASEDPPLFLALFEPDGSQIVAVMQTTERARRAVEASQSQPPLIWRDDAKHDEAPVIPSTDRRRRLIGRIAGSVGGASLTLLLRHLLAKLIDLLGYDR